MKIQTGYLYFIKDEFYKKFPDEQIMSNKGLGHSRPTYLTIKDKDILWFIPLSKQLAKYEKEIVHKTKKYGSCDNILIREIGGKNAAILIQNAFPTLEKYVESAYIKNGKHLKVIDSVKDEILARFKKARKLKRRGIKTMFPDIVKMEKILRTELENDKSSKNSSS